MVSEEMIRRPGSPSRGLIKSIAVTTNYMYQVERRILSSLAAEATTNPTAEVRLHRMEKRFALLSNEISTAAVDVWYADTHARSGEAGYALEKGSNGWKITGELVR
jgi:hypothetical protein